MKRLRLSGAISDSFSQLSYTGMIAVYHTSKHHISIGLKMPNFINVETDFIHNLNPKGEALESIEQSALNLLVELGSVTTTDRDLFSIAIILEMTVQQASNVMFAYTSLLNETYDYA